MADRVIFPTAWDDQGTRKSAFADLFISYMASLGYTRGNSLKMQGAYSFEFHKDGKTTKVGLKSCANRNLNTAQEMVKIVDEVLLFTFKWSADNDGDEVPSHLEIYSIKPKALLDIFDKVHKARAKSKSPNAMAYIPLDEERLKEWDGNSFSIAGGHILKDAVKVFEAPILFSDRGAARIEGDMVSSEDVSVPRDTSQGIGELVFQHKEALAKLYGTSVDKVRILVEA